MIARLASKYIKEIGFDSREKRDEMRRVIRRRFLDFCEKNGVVNSLDSYRQYRAVVRSLYGFDLIKARPTKSFDIIETNLEIF